MLPWIIEKCHRSNAEDAKRIDIEVLCNTKCDVVAEMPLMHFSFETECNVKISYSNRQIYHHCCHSKPGFQLGRILYTHSVPPIQHIVNCVPRRHTMNATQTMCLRLCVRVQIDRQREKISLCCLILIWFYTTRCVLMSISNVSHSIQPLYRQFFRSLVTIVLNIYAHFISMHYIVRIVIQTTEKYVPYFGIGVMLSRLLWFCNIYATSSCTRIAKRKTGDELRHALRHWNQTINFT